MRLFSIVIHHARSYLNKWHSRAFSDQKIASYIAELFESDIRSLEAEGLRFYVKDRILTIRGTVYRELDRDLVIRHASRVVGLKAVVDKMQVEKDVYREDVDARIVLLLSGSSEPTRLLPA